MIFGNRSALGPPMGVVEPEGYWGFTYSGGAKVYDIAGDGSILTTYTKALSPLPPVSFHADFGWQPIISDPSGLVAPGSVALTAWDSGGGGADAGIWVFDPIASVVYSRAFGGGTKARVIGGPFLSGSKLYAVVFYSDESTPATVHLELWQWNTDLTGEILVGSTTAGLGSSEVGGCTHHALTAEGSFQVDVVRSSDGKVLPVSVDLGGSVWSVGGIRSRRYNLSDFADVDRNQMYPSDGGGAAGAVEYADGVFVRMRWATVPDDVSSDYNYLGNNLSALGGWTNAAGSLALVLTTDLLDIVPSTGVATVRLAGGVAAGPQLISLKV